MTFGTIGLFSCFKFPPYSSEKKRKKKYVDLSGRVSAVWFILDDVIINWRDTAIPVKHTALVLDRSNYALDVRYMSGTWYRAFIIVPRNRKGNCVCTSYL